MAQFQQDKFQRFQSRGVGKRVVQPEVSLERPSSHEGELLRRLHKEGFSVNHWGLQSMF